MATNNSLDEEPLDLNEPIQLMKFNSLLLGEQYELCEEGEIHEKDLISSNKKESPKLGVGQLSPLIIHESLSPKVDLEVLRIRSSLDLPERLGGVNLIPLPLGSSISY